jgi:hypothetical protein
MLGHSRNYTGLHLRPFSSFCIATVRSNRRYSRRHTQALSKSLLADGSFKTNYFLPLLDHHYR